MKIHAILAFPASVILCTAALAQTPGEMNSHIAAAKAAARQDSRGTFINLCLPAAAPGDARGGGTGGAGRGATGAPATPDRAGWYASPYKVFDNLYWLGTRQGMNKKHSAASGRNQTGRRIPLLERVTTYLKYHMLLIQHLAIADRRFGTSFCNILINRVLRKIDKAECRRMFQIGDRLSAESGVGTLMYVVTFSRKGISPVLTLRQIESCGTLALQIVSQNKKVQLPAEVAPDLGVDRGIQQLSQAEYFLP
jgi:hypothetical protein